MDGLNSGVGQQISQMLPTNIQSNTASDQAKQATTVQPTQDETTNPTKKIKSQQDVNDLVQQMNDALIPLNTSIKFGVDKTDTFYVSVIDTHTQKMISRYPAEKASSFLPKMQELTGIIFDTKG